MQEKVKCNSIKIRNIDQVPGGKDKLQRFLESAPKELFHDRFSINTSPKDALRHIFGGTHAVFVATNEKHELIGFTQVEHIKVGAQNCPTELFKRFPPVSDFAIMAMPGVGPLLMKDLRSRFPNHLLGGHLRDPLCLKKWHFFTHYCDYLTSDFLTAINRHFCQQLKIPALPRAYLYFPRGEEFKIHCVDRFFKKNMPQATMNIGHLAQRVIFEAICNSSLAQVFVDDESVGIAMHAEIRAQTFGFLMARGVPKQWIEKTFEQASFCALSFIAGKDVLEILDKHLKDPGLRKNLEKTLFDPKNIEQIHKSEKLMQKGLPALVDHYMSDLRV